MPAKSKAAFKFMKMLEHNPKIAKEHGMTSSQAAEYTSENTGKKRFSKLKEKIGKKKQSGY